MARKRANVAPKKDGTTSLRASERETSQHAEANAVAAREPIMSPRRLVIRMVLVVGSMFAARYFFTPPNQTLASVAETVDKRSANLTCSKDYEDERKKFKDCFPQRCGRVVMDGVITEADASQLLRIAKAGLALGGGSGGASILDLHSGALSKEDKFINIYSLIDETNSPFSSKDFKLYKEVRQKIHSAISHEFGIPLNSLHLTKPTFFSRMDARPAMTTHDEYWHAHIDKETYGSFDYTSLLYLSNYGSDFQGGRFTFVDRSSNTTVEPKLGRLSFFTSGSENLHHVEKVTGGVRYAITVSFTCDPQKSIGDPSFPPKKQ